MKQSKSLRIVAAAGVALTITATPLANHIQRAGAARMPAVSGTVGFLFSDFTTSDRWKIDRADYVSALKASDPGLTVSIQDAKADQTRQQTQAQSLLTRGVKAIIDVPVDSKQAAQIVNLAHNNKPRVPVISYDRLVQGAPVDAYVSFDGFAVGKQQAQYLVQHLKKGATIISIAGNDGDNNAHLFHDGAMSVLKPAGFKIVYDKYTPNWDPNSAQAEASSALTQNKNKVDAILCANDGMATGVAAALQAQKLTNKVLLTGQDATIPGLQAIIEGNQSMTIYKPLKNLANAAAKITDALVNGKKPSFTTTVDNGSGKIPSVLLPVVTVTKSNIAQTVIKDGFVTKAQLCSGAASSASFCK